MERRLGRASATLPHEGSPFPALELDMIRKSAVLLIVLASVLLSVGLSFMLGAFSDVSRVDAGAPVDATSSAALEARIAELERRLDELLSRSEHAELATPAPPERTALTSDVPRLDASIAMRIAALETRLSRIEFRRDEPVPAEPEASEEERALQRELAIQEAKRTLADPAATVAEKVAAHGALRRVPDAYTARMVQDLVRIGGQDPSPSVRADVWRFFDGASHLTELVPHLLHAL